MLIHKLVVIASAAVLSSCANLESNTSAGSATRAATSGPTLVGAWEVTASRARGVGKNLLTFSADGTFFRSGDTHPVLSGAHGAWRLVRTQADPQCAGPCGRITLRCPAPNRSRGSYFLAAAALTCASRLSAASLWTDVRTRMSGGSTFLP